jgi:hypothetical protein
MATAAFPGALRPSLVQRVVQDVPGALAGTPARKAADLTIHRITETNHGRTLLILGHAAEHLANSRQFVIDGSGDRDIAEAVHILMGLGRIVFEEFAGGDTRRRRVEQWLIGRVAGAIEGRSGRKRRMTSGTAGSNLTVSPARL